MLQTRFIPLTVSGVQFGDLADERAQFSLPKSLLIDRINAKLRVKWYGRDARYEKGLQMPLDVTRAPASASPLWIIALFIALSEATAGVAAITTDGSARLIFACFAVSFPTIVFAVFVWLLIRHAPNLYAPGQYSKEITPEIYRSGIGISRAESLFLGRAVAETVVPLLEGDEGESREVVVEQVARRFETAVAESSITVRINRIKPGAEALQIPVTEDTTVDSFLDFIYFALRPAVKPFTYRETWVLADEQGSEYSEMGTIWARRQNLASDARHLTEVGIVPGSILTAVASGTERRSPVFNSRLRSLVNDLRAELRSGDVSIENVSGKQRPRLLVRQNGTAYGLYVMPGSPKENEDWLTLARAAAKSLEADRGFPIIPVLALGQQPSKRVLDDAAAVGVTVMWLEQGILHGTPWIPAASHETAGR